MEAYYTLLMFTSCSTSKHVFLARTDKTHTMLHVSSGCRITLKRYLFVAASAQVPYIYYSLSTGKDHESVAAVLSGVTMRHKMRPL